MSWLKNLFVKKKTLNEIRAWVAESQDPSVDVIRSVLVKIDSCSLERSEKQSEIDKLSSLKFDLQEQHSRIVQEKELFIARPEYQGLKESIGAVIKQRKSIEAEIDSLLGPLKSVIGQYAQIAKIPKFSAYADDYVDALIHDYDVGIAKHAPLICASITQGKIKTENPQAAIGFLNALKIDSLSKIIHSYAAARKREEEFKASLGTNQLVRQHEHFLQALGEVQKDISELDSQIAQVVLPSDEEFRKELALLLESHRVLLVESH